QEQRIASVGGVAGHVGQDEAGPHGEGVAGLAPDAALADAQLGGGAGVLEAIALGEGPREELRAIAEGPVEPVAVPRRVVDDISVRALVDGQADGRTGAGQESPPRRAGYSKGDSWPSSFPRHLRLRTRDRPAPNSGTVRKAPRSSESHTRGSGTGPSSW